MEKKQKKPIFKRWWFWAILVIVAITIFTPSKTSDNEPENQEDLNTISQVEYNQNDDLSITEQIERYIEEITEESYSSTDIDSISVNQNLGSESDDYIVLVNYVWNVKNSASTSKEMLEMYSSDLAARLNQEFDEIQEICIFWEVPYLNGNAKIMYEKIENGMALGDKFFDSKFD